MSNPYGFTLLEINEGGALCCPVLLWDGDGCALIDAGFPGQTAALARAIEDAGQNPARLTHIFLTHQDLDHIGCAADLKALAPALKIVAHETEAPYIDGTLPPTKGFESRRLPIDQTVRDGYVLDVYGGIDVIHTPGHTPGHMVLFHRASATLICGDAANIRDGKLVGSDPRYTFDMPLAERSFRTIQSYPARAFITYHGGRYTPHAPKIQPAAAVALTVAVALLAACGSLNQTAANPSEAVTRQTPAPTPVPSSVPTPIPTMAFAHNDLFPSLDVFPIPPDFFTPTGYDIISVDYFEAGDDSFTLSFVCRDMGMDAAEGYFADLKKTDAPKPFTWNGKKYAVRQSQHFSDGDDREFEFVFEER